MKRLIIILGLFISFSLGTFAQSQDIRGKRVIVDQSLFLKHWVDSILNDTTNLGQKTLLTARATSDLLNGRLANAGLSGGNLGSGWRWYDPDQRALRTFVPGTALMFDTATAGELRAAVDTLLMSTRAWRQKGVDSLLAVINQPRHRFGLEDTMMTANRILRGTGQRFRMDSVILHLNGGTLKTGISFFTGDLSGSDYYITRLGTAIIINTPGSLQFRGAGTVSFYNFNSTDGHSFRTFAGADIARFNPQGALLLGTTVNEPSAILSLNSTTKGFRPPRMTTSERNAISSPENGLYIYNISTNKPNFYNGSNFHRRHRHTGP